MPLLWLGVLIRHRHNCRVERDLPVLHRPGLSQDWTTLMFFLASLSDKGVCTLVNQEGEKVKQQSGQRKAQEDKSSNYS